MPAKSDLKSLEKKVTSISNALAKLSNAGRLQKTDSRVEPAGVDDPCRVYLRLRDHGFVGCADSSHCTAQRQSH